MKYNIQADSETGMLFMAMSISWSQIIDCLHKLENKNVSKLLICSESKYSKLPITILECYDILKHTSLRLSEIAHGTKKIVHIDCLAEIESSIYTVYRRLTRLLKKHGHIA